jgi:hypothetical protein
MSILSDTHVHNFADPSNNALETCWRKHNFANTDSFLENPLGDMIAMGRCGIQPNNEAY